MPLSLLAKAPKFTAFSVVARQTAKGNGQCSHGLHTKSSHLGRRARSGPALPLHNHLSTADDLTWQLFKSLGARGISTAMLCSTTQKPTRANTGSRSYCAHLQTPKFPEIDELFRGNKEFINAMSTQNPRLLYELANEGQKPPFMLVDCSDSRVNEQGIFSAQPGTLFTAGNIANQFDERDVNSNAVLAYAVGTLKVRHVVVLGHYGCGGVAASMMPVTTPPVQSADVAVDGWISPIRQIYQTSQRQELVVHRQMSQRAPLKDLPHLHDPAFRALVEENVKANVERIAKSAIMQDHYTALAQSEILDCPNDIVSEVFIHGWVYDVETGIVSDLGVSVGPPGRPMPLSPFPPVQGFRPSIL